MAKDEKPRGSMRKRKSSQHAENAKLVNKQVNAKENVEIPKDEGAGPFSQMNSGPSEKHHEHRTRDQTITLEVPLEDIYFGNDVKFDKSRLVICGSCDGQGIRPGVELKPCKQCDGSGYITRLQRMGMMQFEQRSECPVCHGAGFPIHPSDKCKQCKARGVVKEKTPIEINVPKGITEGGIVMAYGYADEHPQADAGDLHVVVVSAKHSFFTRKDDVHLEIETEISLLEALIGFKRKIKHISGELITLRRDEVTSHGEVIIFEGKGMPYADNPSAFGDLRMTINVQFPESLTAAQLEGIRDILEPMKSNKL